MSEATVFWSSNLRSPFFIHTTAQVKLQSQYVCPSVHDIVALLMSYLTAAKRKIRGGFRKSVSRLEETVKLHIDGRKNE